MANEVYIYRVNEDFSEKRAISMGEWELCIQNLSNLKLNSLNETIDANIKELNGWYPIFDLSGSSKERTFFEFEEVYDKAIEIAEYLECIIENQEGMLIYVCKYGALNNSWNYFEEENPAITREDLLNLKANLKENIKSSISTLIQDRKEQVQNEQSPNRNKTIPKTQKWWLFWR